MNSNYRERLTQGLAIGAAALSLIGCDANKNNCDCDCDNEVKTTAPIITKEVDAKRAMLNKCLEDGDPRYHPAYQIAYDKIKADSSPKRTMAYIGSQYSSVHVNLADCGVGIHTGTFACTDKNADSVWENVRATGCSRTPRNIILRYSQSLEDRELNPKLWQSVQEDCNCTFNNVLKNAGEKGQ